MCRGGSGLGNRDGGLLGRLGSPTQRRSRGKWRIWWSSGGRRRDVIWTRHRQTACKLHGRGMQELPLLLWHPCSTAFKNRKQFGLKTVVSIKGKNTCLKKRKHKRQMNRKVFQKNVFENICVNLPAHRLIVCPWFLRL